MHVAIMLEQATLDSSFNVSGNLNAVFGPFPTGDKACAWVDIIKEHTPGHQWLVIPVDNPNVVNPERN